MFFLSFTKLGTYVLAFFLCELSLQVSFQAQQFRTNSKEEKQDIDSVFSEFNYSYPSGLATTYFKKNTFLITSSIGYTLISFDQILMYKIYSSHNLIHNAYRIEIVGLRNFHMNMCSCHPKINNKLSSAIAVNIISWTNLLSIVWTITLSIWITNKQFTIYSSFTVMLQMDGLSYTQKT